LKRKKIFVVLISLLILAIPNTKTFAAEINQSRDVSRLRKTDLSDPLKTVDLYFEAFRIGDDKLLDLVLAPNAVIPEFNPLQKIMSPDQRIIGPEIVKINKVTVKKKYADPDFFTQIDDVEVYVKVKYKDFPHDAANTSNDHRVFLLRKFKDGWKIIAEIPFWPEDHLEMNKTK
jgi:hypothetical protein